MVLLGILLKNGLKIIKTVVFKKLENLNQSGEKPPILLRD